MGSARSIPEALMANCYPSEMWLIRLMLILPIVAGSAVFGLAVLRGAAVPRG